VRSFENAVIGDEKRDRELDTEKTRSKPLETVGNQSLDVEGSSGIKCDTSGAV